VIKDINFDTKSKIGSDFSTVNFENIFKKASKTYYFSSLLFPKGVKLKVFRLYAFVRRADDYVDNTPQLKNEFLAFRETFESFRNGKNQNYLLKSNFKEDLDIIKSFVEIEKTCNFDFVWTDSFLNSMQMDTEKNEYTHMQETLDYIYGSANVIGLFMSQIMELNPRAWKSASLLGQAFQYINFIRDISEDFKLGRNYFPRTELNKFDLLSLEPEYILKYKAKEFSDFIMAQLEYYYEWQAEAEKGFALIPIRYRKAIKTASELYKWTGEEIAKNPLIVFEKKVKPSKFIITQKALQNIIFN
jgi:15-cis-phytoene synthase